MRLWDVAVNREIAVLDCPNAGGAVAFSPDGRYLVASSDRAIRLWTPWTTAEKLTLPGHLGGIPGIASDRKGTLLASAGKDRTVRIWETASGRLRKTLSDFRGPVQAVAFSPGRPPAGHGRVPGRPADLGHRDLEGRTAAGSGPDPAALVDRLHRRRPLVLGAGIAPGGDLAVPAGRAGREIRPRRRWRCSASWRRRMMPASAPTGGRLASSTKGRLDVFDMADRRPVFSVPYASSGRRAAPGLQPGWDAAGEHQPALRDRGLGHRDGPEVHDLGRRSRAVIQFHDRASAPAATGSRRRIEPSRSGTWHIPGPPIVLPETPEQHLEHDLDPGTEPAGRGDIRRRVGDLGPGSRPFRPRRTGVPVARGCEGIDSK